MCTGNGLQSIQLRWSLHLRRKRAENSPSPQGIFIFLIADFFKTLHHEVRAASACSISNLIGF